MVVLMSSNERSGPIQDLTASAYPCAVPLRDLRRGIPGCHADPHGGDRGNRNPGVGAVEHAEIVTAADDRSHEFDRVLAARRNLLEGAAGQDVEVVVTDGCQQWIGCVEVDIVAHQNTQLVLGFGPGREERSAEAGSDLSSFAAKTSSVKRCALDGNCAYRELGCTPICDVMSRTDTPW